MIPVTMFQIPLKMFETTLMSELNPELTAETMLLTPDAITDIILDQIDEIVLAAEDKAEPIEETALDMAEATLLKAL